MTIRAAIIPGGYPAVVVLAGDEPPLRVLHADSWEHGRLVPRAAPAGALTEERLITPEDVSISVSRAVAALRAYGVDTAAIEWASLKTATSHALATAIRDACEASGIPATLTPTTWRRAYAAPHARTIAERVRREVEGWPERTYRVRDLAAGLALHSVAPAEAPPLVEALRRSVEATAPREPPPAWSAPSAPVERPRVAVRAGLDSGERWVALVIAEGDAPPLRLRYLRVYDVGAWEVRAGGKRKHRVTGVHVDALTAEVARVCREHGVERCVSEHVEAPWHPDGEATHVRAARERALQVTTWVEGSITGALAGAGVHVVRVTQSHARARVCGRIKRGSSPEVIPARVLASFAAWPETSAREREHAFDAGVCAVYDVTPEPRRKATRGRRRAPVAADATANAARRREARAAKRAADGCIGCVGHRHGGECPLVKRTVKVCRKCGGPVLVHWPGRPCPAVV